MINLQRIFGEPESREDKLRRMWTRIYEADQRRKQEEIIQDEILEQIIYKKTKNPSPP